MMSRCAIGVCTAVAVVSLVSVVWAWPPDAFECAPTGNMTCGDIPTIQCSKQGGSGKCFMCTESTDLPDKTCIPVEDGPGCTPNSESVECGLLKVGTCIGTNCTNKDLNGEACEAVKGCD